MSKALKLVLGLFFLLVFSVASYAEIPHLINYQGKLSDKDDNPLEGAYDITFRVYDALTGGNLLWEEVHTGITIQKGIFSVILGSVTNLDLSFDAPYFLEIKVGAEVMSPRQKITSVGYAIRAETADTAVNTTNADTIDGKTYDSTDLKPFGVWETRARDTVYQAATDGFVIAYTNSGGGIRIYVGDNNPPANIPAGNLASPGDDVSAMFPIKKGQYWKVFASTIHEVDIYWVPMGN